MDLKDEIRGGESYIDDAGFAVRMNVYRERSLVDEVVKAENAAKKPSDEVVNEVVNEVVKHYCV